MIGKKLVVQSLMVYDPNDRDDRVELIKKYCLNLDYLSYRHRFLLVEDLAAKSE